MWDFKLLLVRNVFEQILQTWGRSPVCIVMCAFRFCLFLKVTPHKLQLNPSSALDRLSVSKDKHCSQFWHNSLLSRIILHENSCTNWCLNSRVFAHCGMCRSCHQNWEGGINIWPRASHLLDISDRSGLLNVADKKIYRTFSLFYDSMSLSILHHVVKTLKFH